MADDKPGEACWRELHRRGCLALAHATETAEIVERHFTKTTTEHAELVEALRCVARTIEHGDERLLAHDGPVGNLPPQVTMDEWREMYEVVTGAIDKRGAVQKWRCFHCDEVFHTREKAEVHFGASELDSAACQVDIEEYRSVKSRMLEYANEDTELHRTIEQLRSEVSAASRSAEEDGYARGLRDAETVNDVAERLAAWHRKKYGRDSIDRAATYRKLLEEIGELGAGIMLADSQNVFEEIGDCALILMHLLRDICPENTLEGAIRFALTKCEQRLEGTQKTFDLPKESNGGTG